MPEHDMVTYLTETADPPPAVGDRLLLRLRPAGVEAFSAAGRRLGRVPPAECAALAPLLEGAAALAGRVTALVPRPGQAGIGRVHVTLEAH